MEKNNVEKVMYYLSFSIKDVENRYLLIQKLCLTLYFSSTTLILHDILRKVNFKNWCDEMYVDEMSIEWTHMKMDFYFIGVFFTMYFYESCQRPMNSWFFGWPSLSGHVNDNMCREKFLIPLFRWFQALSRRRCEIINNYFK